MYAGQTVTFRAQVGGSYSGFTPTGTVSFLDNGVLIASATLQQVMMAMQASLATTLAAGSHTITVTYNGDGHFDTSSTSLTLAVFP